jgi:hypothetical protein
MNPTSNKPLGGCDGYFILCSNASVTKKINQASLMVVYRKKLNNIALRGLFFSQLDICLCVQGNKFIFAQAYANTHGLWLR